jgi:kynurenine formamidase
MVCAAEVVMQLRAAQLVVVGSAAGPDADWRRHGANQRHAERRSNALQPVHQIALVVSGLFLLENLRLDELAAQRAYEFALIVEPLKIVGATGSTVAPIAVR